MAPVAQVVMQASVRLGDHALRAMRQSGARRAAALAATAALAAQVAAVVAGAEARASASSCGHSMISVARQIGRPQTSSRQAVPVVMEDRVAHHWVKVVLRASMGPRHP